MTARVLPAPLAWTLLAKLALLFVIAALIVRVAWIALMGNMVDALTYEAGVLRWLSGQSPYTPMQLVGPYPLHAAAVGEGFVYPPTSLPLLLPLALGGGAMRAVAFLGALAVAAIAARIVERDAGTEAGLVAFGLTLLVPMDTITGQVSAWMAAAIGAAWLWPRAGSVLVALAGGVKLFPLLAIRWWPALLVLVPLALLTAGLWTNWLTAWGNAQSGCPRWSIASIACATGTRWAGYVVALLLLALAWASPPRVRFFLVSLAMLAPAPDLYNGYKLIPWIGALPMLAGALSGVLPHDNDPIRAIATRLRGACSHVGRP